MKIIESQAAVLTNYEVYQHLVDMRQRYELKKRRGPPNLDLVVKEVLVYLRSRPSPLGQEPTTYRPECIAQLLERLRPYDLSKGEVVMLLNHRPASVVTLNTLIEDLAERFTDEQQADMVAIIAHVLGEFEAGDDAAKADGAAAEGAAVA